MIKLFTIGFAGKSAERFFQLLRDNGVQKIIDTRLYPSSQLSGFAKGKDLKFFLKEVANISYEHKIDFAPTEDLLSRYRSKQLNWKQYESEYIAILKERDVTKSLNPQALHQSCLLCSEHSPENCHRKQLAEYLANQLNGISIIHLI
jgi:uncharacterized protein (DUF488 family)